MRTLDAEDERWMRHALHLAEEAAEAGEVPVGAIVVLDHELVGSARNLRNGAADPLGHAEVLALRDAARHLGSWRMDEVTVYVTLEPCVMCAGALVQSRVGRLVFGARDARMGAVRSLYQACDDPRSHHRIEVHEGLLAQPCADLLQRFFASRRTQAASTRRTVP